MTGVSVLVPCLNPGPYLRECLDAVLPQLRPGDELVVQDACSTDGSAAVLDAAAAADPRVRVRHEPDRGQSDALNRALRRAGGDAVVWLNADDVLLPGALDALRRPREERPVPPDLVIGGWEVHDAAGTVLRSYPPRRLARVPLLLRGCYSFSGAVMLDRRFLLERGGFAEDLHFTMDFDLMLRLAGTATRQCLVPGPVAALRLHAASKSGRQARGFARDGLAVRRRHSRGARERAAALAGTAIQLVAIATHRIRFRPGYTRLRALVRS